MPGQGCPPLTSRQRNDRKITAPANHVADFPSTEIR
jgi:hypothetical protein